MLQAKCEGDGMLYMVSTPIGNLKDITLRALEVLQGVNTILAEDTRRAGILLKHYGIKKPVLSFHDHNKVFRTKKVLSLLKDGKECALISEAGTPGISDPGFYLIRACVDRGLPFTVLPGPSAVINALVLSGLPTDTFYFAGFLSPKKGKRRRQLEELSQLATTLIFFESPHRIVETLEDIKDYFGEKRIALVREMTKVYEEVVRGKPTEVLDTVKGATLKGEFTIVIDSRRKQSRYSTDRLSR